MKKVIGILFLTLTVIATTGCSNSAPSIAPANTDVVNGDQLTQASTAFAQQFTACEANVDNCKLDRDAVIEGSITKIHSPSSGNLANFVDVLDSNGSTASIPILPDSQQKRETIMVDQTGAPILFENISVGDSIKANVKSFDRVENGELTEKLGQYGFIQITQE